MALLVRPKGPPTQDAIEPSARQLLERSFDAHPAELTVNGRVIPWHHIEEIEVVKAARQRSLAGWVVRNLVYAEERYHVGIYFGRDEVVLPNLSLSAARYVAGSIAYYMQTPIRYTGVEGLVEVSDE